MNELYEIFSLARSGQNISLEKNKVYAVAPEDSFHLTELFFSNTANQSENPDGERFCGIYLENKENIVIDGNGAMLMLHGIMTPFIFKNCKNITLKNLEIDHFRPTMSECTVIEAEKGKVTIKINSEYYYRICDNVLYWHSEQDCVGNSYWEIPYRGNKVLTNMLNPRTHIIDDVKDVNSVSCFGFPEISKITERKAGVLELEFCNKELVFDVGTVFQTRCTKRLQTGGAIDECENITLEKLRIYSMNGFGILAQNSRNITHRQLNLTPKTDRTIVSDADFFHFSGCSGDVKVLDCEACGAHDDIINIHGTHLKIVDSDRESNIITIRYCHTESWGFNAYNDGDSLEYVNGNTLIPFASANVIKAEKISPTDFKLTVDFIPDTDLSDNVVVENVTRTASLTVEGNTFSSIPSRAILCTTRKDVIIRNNTFRNMGAPALCVADDANFWFESGAGGRIFFENNTVYNCGARETAIGNDVIRYEPVVMDKSSVTPVHKFLSLKNNSFINTLADVCTVNLNYLKLAEIADNKCNVELVIKCDKTVCVK